ncbi:MAG TPA: hypothetical protein VGO33_07205 [Gemmatimonadaceae bacterium]|jgi:outer membrane murein-binding lipoprotein Lpp|nr:hypothetical protein [Gemmatimonadaceae bacterium]
MKRIIAAAVVLGVVTLAACSSPTGPGGQAKYNQGKTSSSRYMLASGAAPRPGCTDNGDGTQSCPAR